MKIVTEISLENFEAWSGAVSTLDRIRNAGMCDALEAELELLYPDGMTDTELNDLLWFEPETVFEWLGMRTESQIKEEIEEAEERLDELMQEYEEEAEELREEFDTAEEAENAVDDLWRGIYKDEVEEIKERLEELREELSEI